MAKCIIDGCEKEISSRNKKRAMCRMHLGRWERHGNPLIKLKNGPGKNYKCKKIVGITKYKDVQSGYTAVYDPTHPHASKHHGMVKEHIWMMTKYLNRPLFKGENVHHKNGIRDDNRIENLELWNTKQPPGQRLEDKLLFYKQFLEQYGYTVNK